MIDLENRLIRYFLPPAVVIVSLLLGELLGAIPLPDADLNPVKLLEVTSLLLAGGFLLSVMGTCATELFCKLRNTDWEAIVPINDEVRARITPIFLAGVVPDTPQMRDGGFYPFLIYHHVHVRKELEELYVWSVRQFNSSIVAVNSMVGLLLTVAVVVVLGFLRLPGFANPCSWPASLWIAINIVMIVLLGCFLKCGRRRRRRLFQFLTKQSVT